jgi:hypothetical protein
MSIVKRVITTFEPKYNDKTIKTTAQFVFIGCGGMRWGLGTINKNNN